MLDIWKSQVPNSNVTLWKASKLAKILPSHLFTNYVKLQVKLQV